MKTWLVLQDICIILGGFCASRVVEATLRKQCQLPNPGAYVQPVFAAQVEDRVMLRKT